MKAGRPTNYKQSYNQLALDHFRQGKTLVQFAAKLEVARSTVYRWADDNDEFSDTLSRGATLAQAYWENLSQAKTLGSDQKHLKMKNVSERGIEFNLKSRFHKDYGDKSKVDITSDGDKIDAPVMYIPDNGRD